MASFSAIARQVGHCLLRPGRHAAGLALAVVVVCALYADYQNRVLFKQGLRSDVRDELSDLRAGLEAALNSNIQLLHGLIAVIQTEPDMDSQRYAQITGGLFNAENQLRNVAAAPGLVITNTYPLKGNEAIIGIDYRNVETQRDAVFRARDTRNLVLAGPVDLIQGGQGFIARFPVFIEHPDRTETFWGIVAAVIDVESLYRKAGLRDRDLTIEVALNGADGTGAAGARFFGSADVLASEPVVEQVILPNGTWQIAAIPKGGWDRTPDNTWLVWLLALIAGSLIVVPVAISQKLYGERLKTVAKLKAREADLERLSHRLELALDTSQVGVWEHNVETGRLDWDDRVKELFGVPADTEVRDTSTWRKTLHPEDAAKAIAEFEGCISTGSRIDSEFRIVLPGGRERTLRAIGAFFNDNDGRRVVGVNWDVSQEAELRSRLERERRNAEMRSTQLEWARAMMEHNSLHDSLTGLPNRRYLDHVLDEIGKKDADSIRDVALLHIDLDRFKQINDTLGHAAGDATLVHTAGVLSSNVTSDDFVARVGGDEFVILSRSRPTDEELSELAGRIVDSMRAPAIYEEHECRSGVSIGIATWREGESVRDMLVNADIALYRAKRRGRNRFEYFTQSLHADIVRTKRLADDILNGLERNEFFPVFQPQFDAQTLDLVGVEALIRWQHPTEGLLTPDRFLKTAEDLNVVSALDRLILKESLWQRTRWAAAGVQVPKLSVNVSFSRLHDENLIESVDDLDIEPGSVSFELLESIFLDDGDDVVLDNIRKLEARGIDVEIDDFGTGYASIVSLLQLNPRRLKIDRQLIDPIVVSPNQRQLVSSIIEIGRSLGIEVVGEGVETMEHARLLGRMGCDILQGYALSRPMPSHELLGFLSRESWREAS